MSIKQFKCTRCGTEFAFDTDREVLFCPLCGSSARETGTTATSVLNSTTTSAAKIKYVNADFVDKTTKLTVGSASIPSGWKYEGQIQKYNQSQEQPYLKVARLVNSDQTITILARNGDNYLDVRNGIGKDEEHKDGKMDTYFNTPMKRFMKFAEYLDELAAGFVKNVKLTGGKAAKMSSYYGSNATAAKKALETRANQMGSYFANSQLTFEVKATAVESDINEYTYKNGKTTGYLLVGADMEAFEYHLSQPQAQNSGDIMSLFSSLMGSSSSQQSNEGIYINWGSKQVFCCATDKEHYTEAKEVFTKFVASYKETAGLNDKIGKASSSASSAGTSAGSSSSSNDVTSMLMNFLKETLTGK